LLDADNPNQTLAELAHAERLRQRLALATGSKAPRSAAPVTESGRARDRRRRADRGRATDLLRQGVSERVLQALIGHRDARSTRRYARLSDEALVDAIRPRCGSSVDPVEKRAEKSWKIRKLWWRRRESDPRPPLDFAGPFWVFWRLQQHS
jgi:hypothetical protein